MAIGLAEFIRATRKTLNISLMSGILSTKIGGKGGILKT